MNLVVNWIGGEQIWEVSESALEAVWSHRLADRRLLAVS